MDYPGHSSEWLLMQNSCKDLSGRHLIAPVITVFWDPAPAEQLKVDG